MLALLVHLTVSPTLMVIGFGLYPKLTTLTVAVFGGSWWYSVEIAAAQIRDPEGLRPLPAMEGAGDYGQDN